MGEFEINYHQTYEFDADLNLLFSVLRYRDRVNFGAELPAEELKKIFEATRPQTPHVKMHLVTIQPIQVSEEEQSRSNFYLMPEQQCVLLPTTNEVLGIFEKHGMRSPTLWEVLSFLKRFFKEIGQENKIYALKCFEHRYFSNTLGAALARANKVLGGTNPDKVSKDYEPQNWKPLFYDVVFGIDRFNFYKCLVQESFQERKRLGIDWKVKDRDLFHPLDVLSAVTI